MDVNKLKKAADDIVYFMNTIMADSENGNLFKLFDFQEKALRKAFARDKDGRFKFWELYFSWPRKDGKTEPLGIGVAQWFLFTRTGISIKAVSPQSREHAEGIFAEKAKKSIEKNPLFAPMAKFNRNVIEVPELGNKLTILPSEDVGLLGWEDHVIIFDEIGFLKPHQYNLYYNLQSGQGALIGKGRDALLVGISTFGDETEGHPLYDAWQRHKNGKDKRLYFDYSNRNRSPLITKEYLDRQEKVLPRPVFLKFHHNVPGAKSGAAISIDEFNAIINPDLERQIETGDCIRVGLDVGITHDPAAMAGVVANGAKVELRNVECWIPQKNKPVFLPDYFGRVREYLQDNPYFKSCTGDPYEWRNEYQKLLRCYSERRIREYIFTEASRKKLFKNFISLVKNRHLQIYWDGGEAIELFKKQALGLVIDSNWRVSHSSHGDDLVVAVGIACMDVMEDLHKNYTWTVEEDEYVDPRYLPFTAGLLEREF